MTDTALIFEFIQNLAIQLPVAIVAIIGAIVTFSRRDEAPAATTWSVLGFGTAAILCLLVPAGQVGLRYYLIHTPGHSPATVQAFAFLAVIWSLLRAASYVFLLVAIFAGRRRSV
jgi:hypothetical protein